MTRLVVPPAVRLRGQTLTRTDIVGKRHSFNYVAGGRLFFVDARGVARAGYEQECVAELARVIGAVPGAAVCQLLEAGNRSSRAAFTNRQLLNDPYVSVGDHLLIFGREHARPFDRILSALVLESV
jgi:hypothetical protein